MKKEARKSRLTNSGCADGVDPAQNQVANSLSAEFSSFGFSSARRDR